MNEYRLALENALADARNGHEAEALEQLVFALDLAVTNANPQWTSLLARNAAIMSEQMGDQTRALNLLRLSLTNFPNDAPALFTLGNIYLQRGDLDLAREHFANCRMVCHKQDQDEICNEILKFLDKVESSLR